MNRIYFDGHLAFKTGWPITSNPYIHSSNEWSIWNSGYNMARSSHNLNYYR